MEIKVNKVGEKEGKGSLELWINCCLYWLEPFVAYSFQHLSYITSLTPLQLELPDLFGNSVFTRVELIG